MVLSVAPLRRVGPALTGVVAGRNVWPPRTGLVPGPRRRFNLEEGLPDDDCHRDPGSRLRPLGRAA